MPIQSGVSVRELLASRPESYGLPLELLAGAERSGVPRELLAGAEGLERVITSPHIQKTGLALAGFHEYLKPGRVLIFGASEISYRHSLEARARLRSAL